MPMIAGIVLFALGLKGTIEQVDETLSTVPAVALCGGLSVCFLTHVALRVRLVYFIRRATTERPGWIGPGRLVTGIALLALIPAALELPALASLALVAGSAARLSHGMSSTTARIVSRCDERGPRSGRCSDFARSSAVIER
jgi:hypothetical protein